MLYWRKATVSQLAVGQTDVRHKDSQDHLRQAADHAPRARPDPVAPRGGLLAQRPGRRAGEALAAHAATFGSLEADIVLLGAGGIVSVFGSFATDLTYDGLAGSAWYRRLLENPNRIHWLAPGTLALDGSGEPHLVAAALFVDSYHRSPLGVLLISIEEAYVRSLYKDTRISLFDGDGTVLSDSAAADIRAGGSDYVPIPDFVAPFTSGVNPAKVR